MQPMTTHYHDCARGSVSVRFPMLAGPATWNTLPDNIRTVHG